MPQLVSVVREPGTALPSLKWTWGISELTRNCFNTTVSRKVVQSAFAAGLFTSAHASAQEYPAREVSGWTVSASSDRKGCFLSRAYGGSGDTTLLLGLDTDDSNHLSVLNRNWSIQPKDKLELNFRLSNGSYAKHFAVGLASDGKRGFVSNFEAKFISRFAGSTFLHIFRGQIPVEKLSLEGSGAATTELRRCVAIFRTTPVRRGREENRSNDIPEDPFAPDTAPRTKR